MSARNDYPFGRAGTYTAMCEEIDRLRDWKAAAIRVINMWEKCYDALDNAGFGGRLGGFRSTHVRNWIQDHLPRPVDTPGPGHESDIYHDPPAVST